MSEMKHTPGPWKAVSEAHYDSGITYTSVQPVTPDPQTMRPLLMANGEYHVCRMSHTAAAHKLRIHRADAILIAAAPELLDALKLALYAVSEIDNSHKSLKVIRAAISKAEGKS